MIDKSLFQFAGFRQKMSMLAMLSIVQALGIVGQAFGLTKALVEIWNRHGLQSLPVPVAIFFIAFALRHACEVAKAHVATHYADEVVAQLRPQVQHKIFTIGPAALAKRGTGSTVTMLIDGLDQTKTYIQTVLPKMMDMSLIPVVVLIVVWTQSWLSGLVLLLMLPLLFFFMAILGMAARDKSNKQYAEFQVLNNKFVDTILGLPTLKMLGVSEQYEEEIYSVSDRFRKRTMSVIRVAMTSTFALDFFATLAIAIMAVFLGNNLINGAIALFPALYALILSPDYFLPIRQFGDDYHATLNGKNALSDIMDVLDMPEPARNDELDWNGWNRESSLSITGLNFTYETSDTDTDDTSDSSVGVDDDPHNNQLEMQVPKNNATIQDISITLHGFEKIAVIGRSGSGKSTLMNILAGFNIPQSGDIELDGNPLEHFNALGWQRHISYIPQTPYIFNGSIADNIRFYKPDADDDAVRNAAERAGLSQWMTSLPDGFDTQIGEGNRGISGGQAQRIALARVILDTNREILLFDEPTAHLDIETEYDLKETLLPLMNDHLVIFATHRLHWLSDVDRIIMLDNGRIVAQGTLQELMDSHGPLDTLIEEMGGNQIDEYLD